MANVRMRIEPILPEEGLTFPTKRFEKFRSLVMSTMESKSGPEVKRELQKFTTGWETKVNFVARRVFSRSELGITVFPRGPGRLIWMGVSGGVPRHPIFPRTGRTLTFQLGYTPHTRPGGGFGGSGTYGGGVVTRPFVLDHPGIEAREFEKQVKESYEPKFERDMAAVVAKAYA